MMRTAVFRSPPLIVFLLLCLPVGMGRAPVSLASYTFGISLNTGMNNQLFTLFEVKIFEGRVLSTAPMTREQFVLQAQGALPSRANAEGVNLFRKYDVGLCLWTDESGKDLVLQDCAVFDELWKIRFWEYPFKPMEGQHPGKGWAEKREAPSPRQQLLLTEYGIMQLSGMAWGEENVFKLLHDVGDSAWVDNYRKGY